MPEPRLQKQPLFSGRILAIIALSSVLGFTFNASNPLGIRFDAKDPNPQATIPPNTTNSLASSPATKSLPTPPVAGPETTLAKVPNTHNSPDSSHNPLQHALAAPSDYKIPTPITWAQVKPILQAEALVLVDARAKGTYDAGHIPGAVSLPESSPPEALLAFQKQHGAEAHVVVYCSSVSCSLSSKLAHKLAKDYGFTNVQYMTGGYMEWQRENVLAAGPANLGLPPQAKVLPAAGPGSATISEPQSPPKPIP